MIIALEATRVYVVLKLKGGGVRKKEKDACLLVKKANGAENQAPVCGKMITMVSHILDNTKNNPKGTMEEILKFNTEADLGQILETLSKSGSTPEAKIKQSAVHMFASDGTNFFNLHGKVSGINEGAQNAIFALYQECGFKSVNEPKSLVKTYMDIKRGEAIGRQQAGAPRHIFEI